MGADATTSGLTVENSPRALTDAVKQAALRIGFDLVGIAPAVNPGGLDDFRDWLRRGFAGEMNYLPRRETAYSHPRHVLSTVRSVVMLGSNYHTAEPVEPRIGEGRISRYAWGDGDYHDVLRGRLGRLADSLHSLSPGCHTRSVVDTAPLLERDFARLAGLGWFGKNTMLINKRQGSWLFLAGLLTDAELEPDVPFATSHCGTCTRCLDACPTDAFPEPYVLDARKCIAYLTIELKGTIPTSLRAGMGSWIFGCDICQDVCPWNNKSPAKNDPCFQPNPELDPVTLVSLLELDEVEFRQQFAQSPLARTGRSGLLRNAAIALGNQRDERAVPALCRVLADAEVRIREAAAWALGQIGGASAIMALKCRLDVEDNATVREEVTSALARLDRPPR